MAAPLPKEDRAKIVAYLEQQGLSDLTGVKIKELVKENLGIKISQPTASKLKAELMNGSPGDSESNEESSPLKCPTLPEEICAMAKTTKPDKTRQLSIEQQNAIDLLLQGKSDRSTAEAVGVSRQTVWEWRKKDVLFIAELNRQRYELWSEAKVRMKSLANRALDVVELQLGSDDPKAALAAARYVLQGTQLLGDTDLPIKGQTTPEGLILERLRAEARKELAPKLNKIDTRFDFDLYETNKVNEEIEALAKSRLKKAMAEAGLA